jgi:hypothetical protein
MLAERASRKSTRPLSPLVSPQVSAGIDSKRLTAFDAIKSLLQTKNLQTCGETNGYRSRYRTVCSISSPRPP